MPDNSQPWLRYDWFPAGHELIRQGGRSGSLFVLKTGEMEVIRDGRFVSSVNRPGAIFGEMSVLLDQPHSAAVRAVTDVEVYVIADALKVLESHPAWTLQIARLLAQRVNATTALLMDSQRETSDKDRLVLPQNVFAQWADPQV
ncbi:MAG: cyclic nucleotide-binding domain-containing protein [Devosia sp.]|nr:cyclic nucleotide-binding domain-containing protein [Devosia sp.]